MRRTDPAVTHECDRPGVSCVIKRCLDVLGSATILLSTLPLGIAVALAVGLSSPGGVFFRQSRIGRHGRPFRIIKFRTMVPEAGSERGSFDLGRSRRVTAVGRVLRATKLDEWPQFWNVLVGDMSLVGPRPEVATWTAVYPERWARVLSVRPGLTDQASIEFRDEEAILAAASDPESTYRDQILPRKLDLAERYVRERSLALDLSILVRTGSVLFSTSSDCASRRALPSRGSLDPKRIPS